jgi:hypothetical protein
VEEEPTREAVMKRVGEEKEEDDDEDDEKEVEEEEEDEETDEEGVSRYKFSFSLRSLITVSIVAHSANASA